MTYAAFQGSADKGDPIQLFLFRYGTGATEFFAYTDHSEEVLVDFGLPLGIVTFQPVPIERDKIEASGTLDNTKLKVTTDLGTGLAELFRVYPPPNVVSLSIYEGHTSDPDADFKLIWAGRILTATRDSGRLELSGEPVSTSMRRPMLRRHYQYGCMHQLYGPECKANKAAATVSATVLSLAGATVTLAAGWQGAFPPAKFLGGLLEWPLTTGSTERRTILRVTGDVLSLSGLPQAMAPGDTVDVVLGCNHNAFAVDDGDCEGLHDNLPNYGGCRWIPTKNPIGTFNNYY